MVTDKQKKTAALSFLTFALLCWGGYTASAVYSVHDSKVYAEIVAQVKKVTEQINLVKSQINLQKQNLQDLVWSNVGPLLTEIDDSQKEYETLKKSTNSLLSSASDARKAITDTFDDFDDLADGDISFGTLKKRLSKNRSAYQRATEDIITLVNQKQKELEKSQARLQKYYALLKDAKGEKDTLQVQALIDTENVNAKNIQSEITALNTKLSAMKGITEKLDAEASQKANVALGNDFTGTAEEAAALSEKYSDVTTTTGTFYELCEEKGWGF